MGELVCARRGVSATCVSRQTPTGRAATGSSDPYGLCGHHRALGDGWVRRDIVIDAAPSCPASRLNSAPW